MSTLGRDAVPAPKRTPVTPCFAPATYLAAATIKATARRQRSILELPDRLIAAIAVRLRMPLVTGNGGEEAKEHPA
jgi:predicted nucleic acid-binding protein